MLDVEPVEDGDDIGWAYANQAFTSDVHAEPRDAQRRRNMIDHWLLSDLRHELNEEAQATGVTLDSLRQWWPTAATTLGTLPSVRIYRQMMHQRHLNPKTTWRLNDLSDMVYLSCAAATSVGYGRGLPPGTDLRRRRTSVGLALVGPSRARQKLC